MQESERKKHSFGIVPVIEYSSNRFRQGLYEDIISLIDAYDFSQSDTANYMSDLNDATLVIKGNFKATGSDEDEQQTINENFAKMKDANLILLQNGVDANGNMTTTEAGYIYKQYDVNGTESYKKRISKDMHEIANIPDLTDENFAGSQSGEAMKYKLFGFEQYTSTRQKIFVKSLMQRYVLLTNIKSNLRELSNDSLEGFKAIFTPNLPKAVLEELKALIDSGANISQKTMLSLASFISNPESEMQKVDEEAKETEQAKTDLQKYIEDKLNTNQEAESSD